MPDDVRLVRRVERAFAERGLLNGRLDHFASASALARKQGIRGTKINAEILDRAEALFTKINAFLRA